MTKKRVSAEQLYQHLLKKEVKATPIKNAIVSNQNPTLVRLHEIATRMENNLQMVLNNLR